MNGSSNQRVIGDMESMGSLASRLSGCPDVWRYDQADEKEGWTLAHAFMDLENSFHRFLEDLLPRLAAGNTDCTEMQKVLLDIGEEFRHILYHIRDTQYYRYLWPVE